MTSYKYIINELSSLVKMFPEIRARYFNDEYNNSHVIEIIPNETYHYNPDFKNVEITLIDVFIEKFPFENIIFIAGDDEIVLQNIDFEICGARFLMQDPTMTFIDTFSELISTSWIPKINVELFENYYPEIVVRANITRDAISHNKFISKMHYEKVIHRSNINNLNSSPVIILTDDNNTNFKGSGENNYALAA